MVGIFLCSRIALRLSWLRHNESISLLRSYQFSVITRSRTLNRSSKRSILESVASNSSFDSGLTCRCLIQVFITWANIATETSNSTKTKLPFIGPSLSLFWIRGFEFLYQDRILAKWRVVLILPNANPMTGIVVWRPSSSSLGMSEALAENWHQTQSAVSRRYLMELEPLSQNKWST